MERQKDHQPHISRHYREISKSILYSPNQIKDVLNISRLEFDGNQVKRKDTIVIEDVDCARYRESVRAILGEVAYMMLKANFMLAGCNVK